MPRRSSRQFFAVLLLVGLAVLVAAVRLAPKPARVPFSWPTPTNHEDADDESITDEIDFGDIEPDDPSPVRPKVIDW